MAKAIELNVLHMSYLKDGEDVPSERFIVTKDSKQTHYQSLDVTELTPENRQKMAEVFSGYQNELAAHLKTFPNFETWLKEPAIKEMVKWRSFKTDRILPPPEPKA